MTFNRSLATSGLAGPAWARLCLAAIVYAVLVSAVLVSACLAASHDSLESVLPERIEILPKEFQFHGNRDRLHVIVTGHYPGGELRDLTREAQLTSSSGVVAAVAESVVRPTGNGQALITVRAAGQEAVLKLGVSGFDLPQPISFLYGTLPALSKQGCNAGACHGSPSGKGGFRLSLRAFDAQLDQLTLIREEYGRRTNPLNPDSSLLLLKPLMKIPHGGGLQLQTSDPAYEVLRAWIGEGCQVDPPAAPKCVGIEILPPSGRLLRHPAHKQSLAVLAKFSDGVVRDVTDLAVFSSSDAAVATVDDDGLVVGQDRGEVAIAVRYLEFIESTYLTFVKEIEGYEWNDPPADNYVDALVHAKLRQLQYLPGELCSDEEFIRRLTLDVIGLLPTVGEVEAFLADDSTDKRRQLIDALLQREEHAKFWALKWGDLLRMTSETIGREGVHKYHRWVQQAIRTNMPYDEFARQLVTATGSTLENPAANFYRTASDRNECVETVSQIFLGARMGCAKCHNHPFERWSQDNYYGLGAFFHRIQRKKTRRDGELIVWSARQGEVVQPRTSQQMDPWLPFAGDHLDVDAIDRRITFADWLTDPENPFFARMGVNRIWSQLMGQGIVDPVDDFRESNPPAHAGLLDALAKDFVEHQFNQQHVIRTILNSRTYQATVHSNPFNQDDSKYFSHRIPRLLDAEQLLDAICSVTGVPIAFAALPSAIKATQLPAPDLVDNQFLQAVGQPERQTVCQCERSGQSNLSMAIEFLNGPLISGQIRDPNNRFRKLVDAGKSNEEIIDTLYLAAFARRPSDAEMASSLQHIATKEAETPVVNAQIQADIKTRQASIAKIRANAHHQRLLDELAALPEPIRAITGAALRVPADQRDAEQKLLVQKLGDSVEDGDAEVTQHLTTEDQRKIAELESQIAAFNNQKLPAGRIVGLEDLCWVVINRNEFLFNH